jgi:hypothetical protein
MKTKLLLISLLFLTPGLNAQVKPFRFGFKIAPNISWMVPDSDPYEKDGATMGFTWGFLADITLTENYFLRTGFSMDYLGGNLEFPFVRSNEQEYDTGMMNRKYNLRYLEVPVALKMRTNRFGNKAYFGEIGFGTSFNLKARSKDNFSYAGGELSEEFESDISEEVVLVREAMIFGGGVEFFLDESTSILVELTFSNGLNNILKGENTFDQDVKQKASLYYFQLSVGILF